MNAQLIQIVLDSIPYIVSLVTAFLGLWWVIIKENRKARDENKDNYHNIDKRIHGVEVIVGPYAQEIENLKENQTNNMVKITEISSVVDGVRTDQDRMQREIEQLRSR